MKLLQITGFLTFVASAFAQGISIGNPTPGEALTIGKSFTVEVDRPDQLTPEKSVSVAIGLQSCASTPCPGAGPDDEELFGQILFTGSYSPARHENFKPPYENFTFTLAANAQPGHAVIHVAHFFLLEAGPRAILETKNVSVTLAQASGVKFKRVGL